ncbi:MAG: hypothetical protein AB1705_15600 [Verrucomicrobiota bacterium]
MQTISIRELVRETARVEHLVSTGQTIIVTRNGVPTMRITAVMERRPDADKKVAEHFKRVRRWPALKVSSTDVLREERDAR